MIWGSYLQGGKRDNLEFINQAGKLLSLNLGCPVHYPAWDKDIYECKCRVLFPAFMIKYAIQSGDWRQIKEKHNKGAEYEI